MTRIAYVDIAEERAKPRSKPVEPRCLTAVSNTSLSNSSAQEAPAFDKRAYQRIYMAKRRAEQRLKK